MSQEPPVLSRSDRAILNGLLEGDLQDAALDWVPVQHPVEEHDRFICGCCASAHPILRLDRLWREYRERSVILSGWRKCSFYSFEKATQPGMGRCANG